MAYTTSSGFVIPLLDIQRLQGAPYLTPYDGSSGNSLEDKSTRSTSIGALRALTSRVNARIRKATLEEVD
jgi:hypothetical protein